MFTVYHKAKCRATNTQKILTSSQMFATNAIKLTVVLRLL